MPSRRTSIKRTFAKSKWSHENKGCLIELPTENPTNGLYQSGSNIVPATTTQGTRTVGNFTITIPVQGTSSAEIFWALVYVPQGTSTNTLFATSQSIEGSMYEPNQFVLASGISDTYAGPIRIHTRMKRVLHSGDFISLIVGSTTSNANFATLRALVSYSIKYN